MRKFSIQACVLTAALAAASLGMNAAEARGCLKGAAVGGVAGHVAGGHSVIGAVAGCAIEHHREKKADRKAAAAAKPAHPVTTTTPAS